MTRQYPITPPHNHDEVYAKIGEGGGGVTDHGLLTGLADDDHPQYLLTTGKAADADKLDGLDSSAFLQTPSWTSWTPTQSGWTALPTGTYKYFQVGKMCFFAIDITAGTSNSNLAVLSLPVAAKSGTFWGGVNGMAMNNGTVLSVATKWYIDASTGNITFGTDMGSGLWATSGTKRIRCEGFYEIA